MKTIAILTLIFLPATFVSVQKFNTLGTSTANEYTGGLQYDVL